MGNIHEKLNQLLAQVILDTDHNSVFKEILNEIEAQNVINKIILKGKNEIMVIATTCR